MAICGRDRRRDHWRCYQRSRHTLGQPLEERDIQHMCTAGGGSDFYLYWGSRHMAGRYPSTVIDEKEKTPRQVLIPTSHLSEKAPGVPSKLQLSSRTLAIPAPSGLYLLYSNTFLKESHGYGQILEIYLNATALLGSYCMRFSARSIAKHINAAYTELETLTVPPTRNFLSPSPEVPIWRVDVRRELE